LETAKKIYIAIGLLTAAIGTIPLWSVLGVLPSRPPAPGDAPAWLGAAAGLAFFLAGIVVIVKSFASADDSSGELPATAPRALRALYDFLVMPIPLLLALMFSWVAFGPGDRHFTVSAGAGGTAIAMGAGNPITGRIAFGFCAVLAWIIAGFMIRSMARRWFPTR
jgi:hypothetical protein